MAGYEAAARAVIERTARPKALRLAKEATEARDEAAPTTSAKKDGSGRGHDEGATWDFAAVIRLVWC
jgi:hypothetical protein